jgi:hypothetical protein
LPGLFECKHKLLALLQKLWGSEYQTSKYLNHLKMGQSYVRFSDAQHHGIELELDPLM